MRADARKIEQTQFLSGWKDIANYLGKGVRTVQRYERELGLPVRRPAGKPRGSVVVTRAEVDAWVAASPIRAAFQLIRPADSVDLSHTIRRGMQEMVRLREQMTWLQNELRISVDVLRATVAIVRESSATHFQNVVGPFSLTNFDSGPRSILEPVYASPKRAKAS